jgi:hypothetical protein
VATHLERVERREIDRLMILMPPRHGKSELASKSYPAWTIGRSPSKQFISASATADLAHDWGREVRNIVGLRAVPDDFSNQAQRGQQGRRQVEHSAMRLLLRHQPNGAIILINHRMHEDDLSGRLIEQMKSR